MKSLRSNLEVFFAKFWWIDAFYPILLFVLFFLSFAALIYHGEKHRRIASQVEEAFLEFSLKTAGPRQSSQPSKMLTVSLQANDLKALPTGSRGGYRDVGIAIYAKLIEALYQKGARYILVYWSQGKQPLQAYEPLLAVLRAAPGSTRVIFSVPLQQLEYVPKALGALVEVREADPCQQMQAQVLCAYKERWSEWVVQSLVLDFGHRASFQADTNVVSENLPGLSPSYLLYLSPSEAVLDLSFLEVLAHKGVALELSEAFVFVGNSLRQEALGRYIEHGLVKTVLTPQNKSMRSVGTPLHKFWAQIAQQFRDDALIRIAPAWLTVCLALVFVLLLGVCLGFGGLSAAFAAFLLLAFVAPFANAAAIRWWLCYLPVFDVLFAGLATFILIAFVGLSWETWRQWRLEAQNRAHTELAVLRGNFIALVSHNLNTPIAKMQGMVDILLGQVQSPADQVGLKSVLVLVSNIQLCTRFILVSTSLDEGRLHAEALNLDAICQEVRLQVLSPLKKLGLEVRCTSLGSEDSRGSENNQGSEGELAALPLRFDRRVLTSVLAALVVLVHGEKLAGFTLELHLSVEDEEAGLHLLCAFKPVGSEACSLGLAVLETVLEDSVREEESALSLLQELCCDLIRKALKAYQGSLSVEGQKEVNVRLFPSSHCIDRG